MFAFAYSGHFFRDVHFYSTTTCESHNVTDYDVYVLKVIYLNMNCLLEIRVQIGKKYIELFQ